MTCPVCGRPIKGRTAYTANQVGGGDRRKLHWACWRELVLGRATLAPEEPEPEPPAAPLPDEPWVDLPYFPGTEATPSGRVRFNGRELRPTKHGGFILFLKSGRSKLARPDELGVLAASLLDDRAAGAA